MTSRTKRIGERLLVRDGGRWRDATLREQAQAETSPLDAFGLGVAGAVSGMARTFSQGAAGYDASQRGQQAPQIPVTGPEQAMGEVAQFQPGAVGLGAFAPNMIGVNPVQIGRGLGQLGSTMAERMTALAKGPKGGPSGFEMTLGERTGIGPLRRFESAVGSQGGFDSLALRRRQMHAEAGGDMIGLSGVKRLDGEALGLAADTQGLEFNELLGRPFKLRPQTVGGLERLTRQGEDLAALIERLKATEGEVPGELVKNLRKSLQSRMNAARGTDDLMAQDYEKALSSLFDDIEVGMGPTGLDRFRKVRQQWKNLNILESMPELRATGYITPRQASNALGSERGYGKTYVRGRQTGDPETDRFMELTRNLAKLEPIADSGTAARLGPLVGVAAGAAQGENVGDAAQGAVVGGTAGYLIPLALGRALTMKP